MMISGVQVDPEKLTSKDSLMDFLRETGASGRALGRVRDCQQHKFGNELVWRYPISDGANLGTFIVPVKEGFLSLPFNIVSKEDYELLELDDATLLDEDSLQFFIDDWQSYSDDLLRSRKQKPCKCGLKATQSEKSPLPDAAPYGKSRISLPRCRKPCALCAWHRKNKIWGRFTVPNNYEEYVFMDTKKEDLNRDQIIRKDARGCFVETKSDSFSYGKVHLEFSQYDATRSQGQRRTNHVHIYIDISAFLHLTHEALSGVLHHKMSQQKAKLEKADQEKSQIDNPPLYENIGGTSAERLAQRDKTRPDGKSLSRIVKLFAWKGKVDYLFTADSGPGETNATGLIVPKFGRNPENHVSVGLSWRDLNELLLMTQVHYGAWLAAQYAAEKAVLPTM
jgi:hypothetical protein